MRIQFTEELWKEGNMYVSYSPELDISACGESIEQAKKNLIDVIGINIEEMKKLGTLDGYNGTTSDLPSFPRLWRFPTSDH